MNDGIIYYFYSEALATHHSLSNSEEFARHYAENNLRRGIIIFALDKNGDYV